MRLMNEANEEAQHKDGTELNAKTRSRTHIDASHSRQPLAKGEILVRYELNAVTLHAMKMLGSVGLDVFIVVCERPIIACV